MSETEQSEGLLLQGGQQSVWGGLGLWYCIWEGFPTFSVLPLSPGGRDVHRSPSPAQQYSSPIADPLPAILSVP